MGEYCEKSRDIPGKLTAYFIRKSKMKPKKSLTEITNSTQNTLNWGSTKPSSTLYLNLTFHLKRNSTLGCGKKVRLLLERVLIRFPTL
jgi:hypothetical protein